MSDIPKNVEEPTAAPAVTEAPAATEPVADVKPTEPATEAAAPAATEEVKPVEEATPAVEEAAPVVEDVKPVEEGVLGYKGPGLLKGLIFSKKFFWFGSEPVEEKHLSNYLRGEKEASANKNAAWASHTGKGLLFFSKKAADKATPASIINLADISEVNLDGAKAFYFTENGHKHVFEAENTADRDNWVAQIKAKSAEAKEAAPTVTEHETYKSTLDKLKAPVVAVALPKKSTEVKKEESKEEKKEEKTEAKEEKKEEKAEAKEEKKSRKSRSASRKRNSIFGGFGSKKEEKKEEKIESPKEEVTPAVVAPAEAAVPAEATPEVAAAEPVAETTAVETVAPVEPAAPVEETTPAIAETKPSTKKRNSIFGTFKSYVSDSKPKKEEAPVVPAKDVVEPEPVSETAPVIPAVESTEPLATSVASPATVPTETAAPAVTNGETKATETPVAKTDKRKSSIPWLSKKEKPTSDDEAEKPKSPFLSRVIGTVKGKKAEKATPAEKPAETEAAAEEPAAAETTTPVTPVTNPTVAATA